MFLFVMKATKKVVLSLAVVLIAGLGTGIPVIAQTVVIEDGLIGYWSFDKDTVKGNTVMDIWGSQNAQMIGKLEIVPGKFGEAVQLGGGAGARVQITDDIKKAELPSKEMTVELCRALSEKEVLNNLQAEGLAVEPAGKLSLTWGQVKAAARR